MLRVIFFIFGCVSINKSQTIDSKLNVSLSLIKHLSVKNCIFVTDLKDQKLFNEIKYLTLTQNIFTTYKTSNQLEQYVKTPQYRFYKVGLLETLQPQKTVIIWQNNINEISKAFSNIDYVGRIKQFDWIILLNEQNISNANFLKIRYAHYESNFLVVYPIGEYYKILEVYSIKKHEKPLIKPYGTWTNITGLNATDQYIFSRRFNLEGSYLGLYTIYYKKHALSLHPRISNIFEFWMEMSRIMNFSSVNISFDQSIFLGVEDLADVTDATLDLQAWNTKSFGILFHNFVPFWKYTLFLHIKYEADLPVGLWSLMRPFSSELWMILCLWWVISSISTLCTDYLVFKCFSEDRSQSFSLIGSVFAPFETLLNQGEYQPSSLSNRILFISMLAEVIVLLQSYTGAVVSFLTIKHPYFPFNNIDGFVKDGSYHLTYAQAEPLLLNLLSSADDDTSSNFYKKLYKNGTQVTSLQDKIKLTCTNKKSAFLSLNNDYLFLLKTNRDLQTCKILQIPEPVYTTTFGILLNYDSALTSVFKHNWLRFQIHGMANKLKTTLNYSTNDEVFSENEFEEINLGNITPILVILTFGILLAIILLLSEVAYLYLKNLYNKKKMQTSLFVHRTQHGNLMQ